MKASDIRLHFAGDGGVGKTCLAITYTYGQFPEEYVPVVFDNYETEVIVKDKIVTLELWDTAGEEDCDRLRPLSYPGTHVFLLCKSVLDLPRYNGVGWRHGSINTIWVPELHHHVPGVPIILVGTKCDLRDNEQTKDTGKLSTFDEGVDLACKIGAVEYMECSAKTGEGVKEVFERAVKVGYQHWESQNPKKKSRRCQLM